MESVKIVIPSYKLHNSEIAQMTCTIKSLNGNVVALLLNPLSS